MRKQETGNVSSLLDDLNIAARDSNARQSSALQIQTAGSRIPQAAVFDLKTRSARRVTNVLEEELPRFWIAQVPNFILARHESGVFRDIEIIDVTAKVKRWQQDSQNELRQLALLLREIIAAAKARKDRKLEVRRKSLGAVELREQDTEDHDVLPYGLKMMWLENNPLGATDVAEKSMPKSRADGESSKVSRVDARSEEESWLSGWDDESKKDYTGCSSECGYCGHCSY